MQLGSDTALQQAIDANQRTVIHEFMVDWNRNGLYDHPLSDLTSICDAITLDRSITGTLPVETTLVEGFSAAQLQVTLSGTREGDAQGIALLLSPYRADSPLFGQGSSLTPCKWSVGLQTLTGSNPLIRQFTGFLVNKQVRSKDRSIVLTCRDGVELLHKQINLPLFIQFDTQIATNATRINSQWVLDYVLRQNGIYQSPPMHAKCIFSVTGHGAMIPERGHQARTAGMSGVCTEADPIQVPGRWGIACNGNGQFCQIYFARGNGEFAPLPNRSWSVQFQANADGFAAQRNSNGEAVLAICTGRSMFGPGTTTMAIRIARTGLIWTDFYNAASLVQSISHSTIVGPGWSDVFVTVDFLGATLNNCTISTPNQTTTGINLSTLSLTPFTMTGACGISYSSPYPIQNLQVCDATGLSSGATLYNPTTFVSQCDLDPGLNEFWSLPIVRGEDSWELLKSVVGAEYGAIGFSEQGRLYFRNRRTARRQNLALNKTITDDPALKDLVVSEVAGQVRNSISTLTTPLLSGTHYGVVWEIKDPYQLPLWPGINWFSFTPDKPGIFDDNTDDGTGSQLTWDSFPDVATAFVVVNRTTLVEIAGVKVNWYVDYAAQELGVDTIKVSVNVPGTQIAIFATTGGAPAFKFGALVASARATITQAYKRQSSIAIYNEQTLKMDQASATRWWQVQSPVQTIALGLLKDLKRPIPLLDPIPIVGDPRLQLQDTVRVVDDQGLGGPIDCGLLSIRTDWSGGGGLGQNLILRPFASPGTWILGHAERSILGVTTKLG